MDKWFDLIVETLKKEKAHPETRRQALVRAGQIAQAYCGSNDEMLTEAFGIDNSMPLGSLENSSDLKGVTDCNASEENRLPVIGS